MKKIINYTIISIIVILYIILFTSISLGTLINKENVSNLIDEVNLEDFYKIEEDNPNIDFNDEVILKKIVKNSVFSLLNYEEKYTQKEIVELIDIELKNINDETTKEELKNFIYKECIKINEQMPDVNKQTKEEIQTLEVIKQIISNKTIIIISIVLATMLLIPINLNTFKWLKYSGLIIVITSISYLLLFIALNNTFTDTINNANIIISYISRNIQESFKGKTILFFAIGLIQLLIYKIIYTFKVQPNINKNK